MYPCINEFYLAVTAASLASVVLHVARSFRWVDRLFVVAF